MADLISRAVAIDVIGDLIKEYRDNGKDEMADGMIIVRRYGIRQLPAVDAVPVVHARWRELKDGTEECTNCLGLCPHEENYNGDIIFNFGCEYCPWCGAKMDDEQRNGK